MNWKLLYKPTRMDGGSVERRQAVNHHSSEYQKKIAELEALNAELVEALKAISSNPHCNLEDLIYKVRDSEGEGWHGPAVTSWSNAVEAIKTVLAKTKGGPA